jgi:carboxyl-terminal processing protease
VQTREGAERTLRVERADVVDPTVRHARIVDEERGIGYLAITSFSHETSDEFDRAVEALRRQGLKALVIDVRGNPGGVLVAAVRIVNRFVSGGIVVSTEGRGEPQLYEAVDSEARWNGMPLCVLADQDSASASEVLAGALQDWRAAALVGSRPTARAWSRRSRPSAATTARSS